MSELNMPDTWAETKLNDICSLITDGTHQTPTYADEGVIFLSSKNVTSGRIDWERIKYIPESLHLELSRRLKPQLNDILLAKNGTTGVGAIVDRDEVFDIYVSLALLRLIDNVSPRFILTFINSPIAKEQFNRRLKGVGVQNLHLREIREVRLGLPPYGEQERIVNYVEALFEKIDATEQNLSKVETLLEKYRESLLAKAFRGELIPQNESDEPASVLLEKIRVEREKSASAKKKEVQAFAPITDDEKPFDIPESWEWVRIGELCVKIGSGKTPKGGSNIYSESGIPLIRSQNVYNSEMKMGNVVYITEKIHKNMKNSEVKANDTLLNITGGSIGRTCVVPSDWDTANVNQHVCIIRPALENEQLSNYISNYLQSIYGEDLVRSNMKGAARDAINMEQINNFPLPLPPMDEIKKILNIVRVSKSKIKSRIADINKSLQLIPVFRNSVLAKAFEGRLVEQIESEGTGQELLEKILRAKEEENSKKKIIKKTEFTIVKKNTKEARDMNLEKYLEDNKTGEISSEMLSILGLQDSHEDVEVFYLELKKMIESKKITLTDLKDGKLKVGSKYKVR